MKVRLIAKTSGFIGTEYENRSLDEIIVGIARLSSSRETNELFDEPHKLLRHCVSNGHWSVFTMANLTFEIETSRAIGREYLRHKSSNFQEFCVAGDTLIYFDSPSGLAKQTSHIYKMPISEFYHKWHHGAKPLPKGQVVPLRDRLDKMNVRIYDEHTKTIGHSTITDVFKTGIKDVFELELEDGKKIKCTKEHRFFVKDKGWASLELATGLRVFGKTLTIAETPLLAVNGVICHQDKEWLAQAKKESLENKQGLPYIAEKAGVSYHTIRKWLKIHDLRFTKKETASYCEIWNKGKTGYNLPKHKPETILKMKEKARRGSDSNLWRGGADRSERLKIQDWARSVRSLKLNEANYCCQLCGLAGKLQLHHIIPVHEDPSKAYDYDNLQVVCIPCHQDIHRKRGDYFGVKNRTQATRLVKIPKFSKVKSIKYIGKEETYDLTIAHESHNYIANGIVTHNSQRYSDDVRFEPVELRKQCRNNRQSSSEPFDPPLYCSDTYRASDFLIDRIDDVHNWYSEALRNGVSRETARFILPECTQTTLVVNATVREWITTLNQRLHKTAQKEARLVAEAIREVFIQELPITSEALFNFDNAYEIPILDRVCLEKYGVYQQALK